MEDEAGIRQKGRGRGKKRKTNCDAIRASERVPKKVCQYNTEDTWTVIEKKRLLDGLKRYNCHNLTSLSKMVGSKTEMEVEEKIQSLRSLESTRKRRQRVEGRGSSKAPIEAWIDLVQEMTNHETADYSTCLSKVLGLITRNETFASCEVPRLKWENIYQFLNDLAEDRVETQHLSDMESLVVLDMMHSLGDTLHNWDTSQQRHVLDLKYQLLNFKTDLVKDDREASMYRIAQALRNDFWELDDAASTSGVSATTLTSLQSQTRVDQQDDTGVCEREPDVNMVEKDPVVMMKASSSNQTSASSAGEMLTSSFNETPACSANKIDAYENSKDCLKGDNLSCLVTESVSNKPTVNHSSSSRPGSTIPYQTCSSIHENPGSSPTLNCDEEVEESSSEITLLHSPKWKKFIRPKYFTLNPLCVPTHLLDLKPKSDDV